MTHFCTVFPARVRVMRQAFAQLQAQRKRVAQARDQAELLTRQAAFAQARAVWAGALTQTVQQATNMKGYLDCLLLGRGEWFKFSQGENPTGWVRRLGVRSATEPIGGFLPDRLTELQANFLPVSLVLDDWGSRCQGLEKLRLHQCSDLASRPEVLLQAPRRLNSLVISDSNVSLPVVLKDHFTQLHLLRIVNQPTFTSWPGLPKVVRVLELRVGKLNGIPPDFAQQCPHLQWLILPNVKGLGPADLLSLPPNLRGLRLQECDLSTLPATFAQAYPQLEKLNLRGNSDLAPEALEYLPSSLTSLSIDGCAKIKRLPPGFEAQRPLGFELSSRYLPQPNQAGLWKMYHSGVWTLVAHPDAS